VCSDRIFFYLIALLICQQWRNFKKPKLYLEGAITFSGNILRRGHHQFFNKPFFDQIWLLLTLPTVALYVQEFTYLNTPKVTIHPYLLLGCKEFVRKKGGSRHLLLLAIK
jgi:hypothetical protein